MSELRDCFSDMGLGEVTTVLQTGNVLFNSDDTVTALKATIEAALQKKFDYPARVQVYRLAKLRKIVEGSPFGGGDSQMHSYVVFFEGGLENELVAAVGDLDNKIERVEAGDGVLYWRVPKGSTLTSDFAKYLVKARYRDLHTSRNINTLRKIVGE